MEGGENARLSVVRHRPHSTRDSSPGQASPSRVASSLARRLKLVNGIAKERDRRHGGLRGVAAGYDISDVTSLMGVRLMMDVIGTMAKNGRIGGRLKI